MFANHNLPLSHGSEIASNEQNHEHRERQKLSAGNGVQMGVTLRRE